MYLKKILLHMLSAMSKICTHIETPIPENVWLNLSQLNLTLCALVSKEIQHEMPKRSGSLKKSLTVDLVTVVTPSHRLFTKGATHL